MRLFCVVPTWKTYPETCVKSIELQNFQPECTVIGIDDFEIKESETDKSYKDQIDFIADLPSKMVHRWCKERLYAAKNIYHCIKSIEDRLKDNDIICLIDGDDHLSRADALSIVYQAHTTGAWLTYGSYYKLSEWHEDKDAAKKHRGSYRNDENYRKLMWRASHLKTFRYGLYRRLNPNWYFGPDRHVLRVCSDLALMFPMMEMAGKEHIRHIDKAIYVYNDMSPDNDHKVRGKEQKEIEYWLRFQEPYQKINSLSGTGENLR